MGKAKTILVAVAALFAALAALVNSDEVKSLFDAAEGVKDAVTEREGVTEILDAGGDGGAE